MAVLPEAPQVDEEVLAELLAVLNRQAGDAGTSLGVFTVDVEDRGLDELGDVGAVGGAAVVFGEGGEGDEVVDDDVDGAADGVALELGHVEGFGDHALPGHSTVAVHQERDDAPGARCFIAQTLLSPQRPMTTPSTDSKWLGLLAIARRTCLPLGMVRVME